jgi:hypothetical protein
MPDVKATNTSQDESAVTLFDLAVELLLSINRGSAAQHGPKAVIDLLNAELNWLADNDIINLPDGGE